MPCLHVTTLVRGVHPCVRVSCRVPCLVRWTAVKAARICELGLEDVIAVMKAHPYKPASRSGSARAVQENAAGVLWSLAFSGGTVAMLRGNAPWCTWVAHACMRRGEQGACVACGWHRLLAAVHEGLPQGGCAARELLWSAVEPVYARYGSHRPTPLPTRRSASQLLLRGRGWQLSTRPSWAARVLSSSFSPPWSNTSGAQRCRKTRAPPCGTSPS